MGSSSREDESPEDPVVYDVFTIHTWGIPFYSCFRGVNWSDFDILGCPWKMIDTFCKTLEHPISMREDTGLSLYSWLSRYPRAVANAGLFNSDFCTAMTVIHARSGTGHYLGQLLQASGRLQGEEIDVNLIGTYGQTFT